MSYIPTNWVSGETPLSAENMNHIEQGIAELDSKSTVDNVTLSFGTVTNARPVCYKYGNVLIINFVVQLPAKTYNNSNAMWSLPTELKPLTDFRFVAQVGTTFYPFVVTSQGVIRPNSAFTISSSLYMQGIAVVVLED